jgi:hypothetical protein
MLFGKVNYELKEQGTGDSRNEDPKVFHFPRILCGTFIHVVIQVNEEYK